VQHGRAFDEGRFGLKVWFRRRWCPSGERPPWVYVDAYEWRWLYAAVEPLRGDSFFLLLPRVDTACLQAFLDQFGAYVQGRRVGVVLDGSGAHRARELRWPAHLVPLPLPPYSPELNPAEQVFRHLRARLANRIFADVAELEEAIADALRTFWDDPPTLRQLTGYPWWIDATRKIAPIAS
jgi:transposase